MSLTDREIKEIERANTSGRKPVVFVHGLWLLAGSWERWRELFEEAGFTTLAPGWPDEPESVAEARARPEVLAKKSVKMAADHYAAAIERLREKPGLVGHSFGGLITQLLAGRGLAAASVAIDPAPFQGVLPLPLSALKASAPVLTNPRNYNRAVTLTFEQFRFAFANALEEAEARELYDAYAVAAPGMALFQAATANVNPWSQLKAQPRNPARGPLLIVSGEKDNIVPHAMASAAYRRQKVNAAPTEFRELPRRGHSLIVDSGWREVAETALEFLERQMKVGTEGRPARPAAARKDERRA
jgi:pimeloyl-ACP methyl ester carboxylesterase